MYVVIEPRYEDPIVRQILPHEILDGDAFAASYAAQCGQELSPADEEIPDGSGDFRITIKDEPPTPGGRDSTRIWFGKDYRFACEDD
jgi:hypothetical protein